MYGCVQGEFTVLPNIPEELQAGIFKLPRSYPCWLRFSSTLNNDKGKGILIKILAEPGKEYDFTLLTSPILPLSNLDDVCFVFETYLQTGKILGYFLSSYSRFKMFLKFAWGKFKSQRQRNLLDIVYWGIQAYQLGDRVCKYRLEPTTHGPNPASNIPIKENFKDQLRNGEAVFNFMIQLQTDSEKMSADDLSVLWDEKDAPYRKVATLTLFKQEFDFPERIEFGNSLLANPWNCHPENKPVGWAGDLRKLFYETLQKARDRN